jgi:hypothetical protein
VNLKRHVVRKDGKEHVYYSLSETIRINKNRTVQRRVLNLGELNTTQTERWQRSIEVIEAEGQSRATPGFLPIAKVGLRRMPLMRAKSSYQVCRFDGRGSLVLVG